MTKPDVEIFDVAAVWTSENIDIFSDIEDLGE